MLFQTNPLSLDLIILIVTCFYMLIFDYYSPFNTFIFQNQRRQLIQNEQELKSKILLSASVYCPKLLLHSFVNRYFSDVAKQMLRSLDSDFNYEHGSGFNDKHIKYGSPSCSASLFWDYFIVTKIIIVKNKIMLESSSYEVVCLISHYLYYCYKLLKSHKYCWCKSHIYYSRP